MNINKYYHHHKTGLLHQRLTVKLTWVVKSLHQQLQEMQRLSQTTTCSHHCINIINI